MIPLLFQRQSPRGRFTLSRTAVNLWFIVEGLVLLFIRVLFMQSTVKLHLFSLETSLGVELAVDLWRS